MEDLGLTNAEIKVYLAALELGTATAGPILEKTGLQNSVVHMTLPKLVTKGFLSFVKKGKIKHYQATNPENILNFIDEKKKRFNELLPELISRQNKQKKQEAEIFEGFKGFKNAFYELLNGAKEDDDYLFFSFNPENLDDYRHYFKFYKDLDKYKDERGIVTKGIAPNRIKEAFIGRNPDYFLFVDFPVPTNITICNDKIIFLSVGKDQEISYLLHSKEIAENFRKYFYVIWNQYKN